MKLNRDNTVFVTGGTGSVGRNILIALRNKGIRVKALARSVESEAKSKGSE
jgi:uncharacterized protein YbjT (DUF2867 family)